MHFDTRQTQWQEPNEPYWVWDALRQTVHASGLQQPSNREHPATSAPPSSEPEPEGERYNPAIHGNYDPTAPYAKRYEDKRRAQVEEEVYGPSVRARQSTGYAAVGAFNRFSGAFQTSDKSADRHNDYNKSGRQMRNFFDVDAAANVHGGKSLKDERRQAKIGKKELHALKKKKREKKEKKRLDFYKS
ncbi:WW domain protein [Teratosphaeria destructans]|uniref:WW domain protein n=1 Tax=Teratosphaeria destructans TaxID=418781 RepID=A0A9W7W064_9PEZI|nr:WW domain protein [Teratosphaeria destructans]